MFLSAISRWGKKDFRCWLAAIAIAIAFILHGINANSEVQSTWLIAVALLCWVTGTLPGWWAGLLLMTMTVLFKIAPVSVSLAGMISSATWMVLAGIVLGEAIEQTGLGQRLAMMISPWLRGKFSSAIWGSMLLGIMMMFIMPSAMSRVLLLLPLLAAIADELGYSKGRPGRTGIIMAGVLGTYLPATAVLPANIPNNVLAGAVESLLGQGPQYGTYLLLHFPVLGILKIIMLGMILNVIYRDDPPSCEVHVRSWRSEEDVSQRHQQQKLAILLLVTVVLWCTESIHGLGAAWVGMLAAMICLCPGTGLLSPRPLKQLDFGPVFYVAGIVSMGTLAYHCGLATDVARAFLQWLPLSNNAPVTNFMALSGLSTAMGGLVTLPGVPAVLTPMTPTLANAAGWSEAATYMVQVVGFSTVWLPYQAPPLVMAIQSGHLSNREVIRMCLITAVLSVLILWPLDVLWWKCLGWL